MNDKDFEFYCTLFDSSFLPMGLSLIESLQVQSNNSFIFVLCMDKNVYSSLLKCYLKNVTLIKLDDIEFEFPQLIETKKNRTKGEYCWTLTPCIIYYLLLKNNIKRITYLDADLFFFSDPLELIYEMLKNSKDVLITEHGYDPMYDQSQKSGRFCVQFMTFNNTKESQRILLWWKEKCIEWCYNKFEDGKFGDQKYLDVWPEIFQNAVHILQDQSKTLAPWNVHFISKEKKLNPVLYHFHGFRLQSPNKAILYSNYNIGKSAKNLYNTYCISIKKSIRQMKELDIPFSPSISPPSLKQKIIKIIKSLLHNYKEKNLSKINI